MKRFEYGYSERMTALATDVIEIGGKWYAYGDMGPNTVCGVGRDVAFGGVFGDEPLAVLVPMVATPSPSRKAAVSKARRGGVYLGRFYGFH